MVLAQDAMRQQYEDALHELTPTTIEKVWVKNVDKAGMYILYNCLLSKLYTIPILTTPLLFDKHRWPYGMDG